MYKRIKTDESIEKSTIISKIKPIDKKKSVVRRKIEKM